MSGIPFTEEVNKTYNSITYNEVANKLLKDNLLLTALELHTELLESGRELKQLKDFFSNPGNFEYQTQDFSSRISRSGSQVTLDSLDLTRLSEDGAGTDERVAVLEFELRKAKETINSLRNHLTVATESESSSPDKGSLRNINVDTIKPHEQRALNFLINEYLLLHNYKLTSITFADENQNQDFDDWDDVGLNIAKPPELLSLYREGLKQIGSTYFTNTIQTQTIDDGKDEKFQEEIGHLRHKLNQLESEQSDLKSTNSNLVKQNELLCSQISAACDDIPLKNTPNSKDSFGSESPSEKFEIIDKSMSVFKKTDSITTLEDNISNNSFNTSDWMNVTILTQDPYDKTLDYQKDEKKPPSQEISSNPFNIDISNDIFKKEVFALCYVNIPQKIVDNEVLENVFNNSITSDNLIHVLSVSLLRIIPNIILIKREEAIPLLISAVHLNPNSHERDKLLQQLFNLKKKPNDSERFMILAGIVEIAKFSEEAFVENEILPQCWEQLSHKYVEKRLLVAEACIALIPYVSSQIRNSLILSMLQQMLDDRDIIVRKIAIRAFTLVVALCDDDDKYSQCEELVLTMLNDSSLEIVNLSRETLFPVLSKWALSNGRLTTSLIKSLLQKLNDCLRENDKIDKTISVIHTLESILPFLLMSVADNPHIIDGIQKDLTIELRNDLKKICSNLTNPLNFYSSNANVSMMLNQFENYISQNPNITWPEMDWIIDMMIPDLINNLSHIESNQQVLLQSFIGLFSTISIVFGKNFTKLKIRPILRIQIDSLVQIMSSFSQFCPNLNLIPVYLVSVLSFCDLDELMVLLKKFICALPLCGTPLECLELTVQGLSDVNLQEVVVTCLWEGVVHQRPLVRAATANLFAQIIQNCDRNLLISKITPALVTLASDSDVFVRTATIPALGALITNCNIKEIHDKVYLQIQSYITDTNLKENHSLLRQLIVTLGQITVECTPYFRNEVILPQLCSFSTYMVEMTNQTRKVDLAQALVEAYTNVVYGPFNKQNLGPVIIPGLRCLENVVNENQSLACHRETVLVMMRECDEKFEPPVSPSDRTNKLSHNVNQGVEEMRQRVSKIFNKPALASSKPNTLPNLQGIFKKK